MINEKMTLQALVLIACAPSAILAANTWTGTGDWNTAANWSEGVPDVYRTRFLSGNFSAAIITNEPKSAFTGTVTATCGTVGHVSQVAQPGSVVFLTSPPLGSLLIVR